MVRTKRLPGAILCLFAIVSVYFLIPKADTPAEATKAKQNACYNKHAIYQTAMAFLKNEGRGTVTSIPREDTVVFQIHDKSESGCQAVLFGDICKLIINKGLMTINFRVFLSESDGDWRAKDQKFNILQEARRGCSIE